MEYETRRCEFCGDEYEPKNDRQKFCNFRCQEASNDVKRGRWIILSRDEFRCIYCGRSSIEDEIELHVDHIVPVDADGMDVASNLVTACKQCNLEKSKARLSDDAQQRIADAVARRNVANDIHSKLVISLGRAAP